MTRGAASTQPTPFEEEIERRARQFDLRPLLKLLEQRGYGRQEIIFESSMGGSSASVVDAVRFVHTPVRTVYITLNIGLLGDGSLLPSYFFEVIERTRRPDRFYDFIRYFDHWLLSTLVASLFPEDHHLLFDDFAEARRSFVHMLGMGSVSTLWWLGQLLFPELRVRVERLTFSAVTSAHAARPGRSALDGTGILGRTHAADVNGFLLDLVAEEETDARGRGWAGIVRERLAGQLLPLLSPFRVPVEVRLTVLTHASWATLEAGENTAGYLGYDRIRGDAESGHTIVIHPATAADWGP